MTSKMIRRIESVPQDGNGSRVFDIEDRGSHLLWQMEQRWMWTAGKDPCSFQGASPVDSFIWTFLLGTTDDLSNVITVRSLVLRIIIQTHQEQEPQRTDHIEQDLEGYIMPLTKWKFLCLVLYLGVMILRAFMQQKLRGYVVLQTCCC